MIILASIFLFCSASVPASSPSCETGTVTAAVKSYYIIENGTNLLEILQDRQPGLKPGDRVLLPQAGEIHPYSTRCEDLMPFVVIGHDPLPMPPLCELKDLSPRQTDKRRVRLRGWVQEAIIDPIDPAWMRLVLKSGLEAIDVAVPIESGTAFRPRDLKYATVEVSGLYRRKIQSYRRFATTSIETTGLQDISVLSKPSDPYDLPSVRGLSGLSATEILAADACTAAGQVVAVWGRHSFLLHTRAQEDPLVRIDLEEPAELPRCGNEVKAVGLVRTDLYHLRLTDASWRKASAPTNLADNAVALHRCVLTGGNDDVILHGGLTCATGTVRELIARDGKVERLRIATPDKMLNADVSALGQIPPTLEVGATIALQGVCIAETDAWRPGENLATFRGMTLVPRSAADIRILARPSWWTPRRLLAVIFILTALLVGIVIWNRLLMRLANRRGHELFRSEYARAIAVLRVGERTRLATELHDSLSQSIAGIACQVVAARHALPTNPAAANERLTAAENMLSSCRSELSNCLFDLRGDMLEESDFSTAVKKSLALVAGSDEHVSVRMNIPRSCLHDATAHAILCIVRELVSNALRHGNAECVRVTGCIDGGQLRFSVTDDGIGFDAKTCPGPDKGHFGLTGIRDRVRKLKGTIEIKSTVSTGTRIAVALPVPTDTSKQNH